MQSPAPHSPELPPDQESPPTYPEETPQQKSQHLSELPPGLHHICTAPKNDKRHNWIGRNNPAHASNSRGKTTKPTPSLYEKFRQLKSASAVDTWGKENHKKGECLHAVSPIPFQGNRLRQMQEKTQTPSKSQQCSPPAGPAFASCHDEGRGGWFSSSSPGGSINQMGGREESMCR